MRSLFAALILVGSLLVLAGCDNGNNDSTSGGGSNLSLSGTWYVIPNVPRPRTGYIVRPYFVTLGQTGKAVVSSGVAYDPLLSSKSCDQGVTASITGTASGNTFTGQYVGSVSAVSYSTATFTVTGTSNLLAGSYRVNYNSGPCLGARTGTVTMKRN